MTKDEALDLALEALEKSVATCFDRCAHEQVMSRPEHFINQAITAIKQARALDKMAENARELGLDYEPVAFEVGLVEWVGNKLMATPKVTTTPPAQPAPVQKPVPDYAWPTVADYEKDVGFEVNDAFKMAWGMARTTNALFIQVEKNNG
jgi:hypothetical protein